MRQATVSPADEDGHQPHQHQKCDLCPRPMVCVTMDTSPSFLGDDDSKLKMMTSFIQRLISLNPTDTTYVIRSFSHLVDILMSRRRGQKQIPPGGDMETVLRKGIKSNQILGNENLPIRLYDGCAETIREIPVKNLHQDRIFILILSGSRDTGSGTDTLDTLIDLINDMMRGDCDKENICLVFIQAGRLFKGLTALEEKCWFKKVHIIKVQDSTHKIQWAFKKAEQLLESHFAGPYPCPSISSSCGSSGVTHDEACPAVSTGDSSGGTLSSRRRARRNSLADSPFKVLVSNIPPLSKLSEVESTFSQFGRCKIDRNGRERTHSHSHNSINSTTTRSWRWWPLWFQWLILSFESAEGMRVALSQKKKIVRQSHQLFVRRLNHQEYLEWIENKKFFKWPTTNNSQHGHHHHHGKSSWWLPFLFLCLSTLVIGYTVWFGTRGGGRGGGGRVVGRGGVNQNSGMPIAFKSLGDLQQFLLDAFELYDDKGDDDADIIINENFISRPLYEIDENELTCPAKRTAIRDLLNNKGYHIKEDELGRILDSMGGVKSTIIFKDSRTNKEE